MYEPTAPNKDLPASDTGLSQNDAGSDYDVFISYSSRSDYTSARHIEAFLEGLHTQRVFRLYQDKIPPLQACRDGSDFRLPHNRSATPVETDPVWQIIRAELMKSHNLLVLCSPAAAQSAWVDKEIGWFLQHRGEGSILLAVMQESTPPNAPDAHFPEIVRQIGLQKRQIWYDLRRLHRGVHAPQVRNPEDELIRLAADIHDLSAERRAGFVTVWQREQLRRQRQFVSILTAVAATIALLGVLTLWYGLSASREAARRRADALVLFADNYPDPLTATLLLTEMQGSDEPDGGMKVAQRLALQFLPQALLHGHTSQISSVAFRTAPVTHQLEVVTASDDGTVGLWPADGYGDARFFRGPRGKITAVALDPTQAHVAASSTDGTVRLWNAVSGDREGILPHTSPVKALHYADQGRWIVTLTESGALTAYSITKQKPRPIPIPGHAIVKGFWANPDRLIGWAVTETGDLWRFAAQPDATFLMTAAARRASWRSNDFPQTGLDQWVFSPRGTYVGVTSQKYALVQRCDGSAPPLLLTHPDFVRSLEFCSDESKVITACTDGKARIWTTDTGKLRSVLDTHVRFFITDLTGATPKSEIGSPGVLLSRFSHDATHVVTLNEDGVIRIWNADGIGEPWLLRGHAGASSAAFSDDDKLLATGADDGTARVWKLMKPDEPLQLAVPAMLYDAAFSPAGGYIATGDSRGTVYLWHIVDKRLAAKFSTGADTIRRIAYDRQGHQLLTVHSNGAVMVWSVTTPDHPTLQRAFLEHHKTAVGALFSPDGGHVLSWSEDRTARLWRSSGTEKATVLEPQGMRVEDAAFSPDGDKIAVAYENREIHLWHADGSQHRLLSTPKGHTDAIMQIVFSPDNKRLLSLSEDGTARLWTIDGNRVPVRLDGWEPGRDGLSAGAFSPDGNFIAIGSFAGRAFLWRADGSGKPLVLQRTLDSQLGPIAHIGPIAALEFDQQAKHLMTVGASDLSVCIWPMSQASSWLNTYPATSLHRLGEVVELKSPGYPLVMGHFSPDGTHVLGVSDGGGTVFVWRTAWNDLLAYLRARTTANLSAEQRSLLLDQSDKEARASYEAAEARFHRTPLPPTWQFTLPRW